MWQRLKTYIIPIKQNNYYPTILQKAAMSAMLGLVVLSFVAVSVQSMLWTRVSWMVSSVLPAVIIAETNVERGAIGTLTRSPVLDTAAQMKAEHMAKNAYFSHYSPDGISPWYWFAEAGYSFLHAGENLAVHFNDSEDIIAAWMASPTHRANIMNQQFTEIGIGVARGEFEGSDTIFVVQLFGTPMQVAAAIDEASHADAVTVVSEQVNEVLAISDNDAQVASADQSVTIVPTETSNLAPSAQMLEVVDTSSVPSVPEVAIEIPASVEVREGAVATNTLKKEGLLAVESNQQEPQYSDTITTSTNQFIGMTDDDSKPRGGARAFDFSFLTSPHSVLEFLYTALALFIVTMIVLSILIEIRRQHPVQIAYGLGLAAVMLGLLYAHSFITAGIVIA